MEARIVPEPTEEERRAILAALAAEDSQPAPYRSAWRRAALEQLGGDLAEDAGGDAGVVEP